MNEYHFITLFIALALCGSILDESRGLKRKLISATELAVASKDLSLVKSIFEKVIEAEMYHHDLGTRNKFGWGSYTFMCGALEMSSSYGVITKKEEIIAKMSIGMVMKWIHKNYSAQSAFLRLSLVQASDGGIEEEEAAVLAFHIYKNWDHVFSILENRLTEV